MNRVVGVPAQNHRRLIFRTVLVAVLTAGIWAVVRFVSPAPPRSLVMSTGVADGAYHRFGQHYQEILRANGITLELRPPSGGVENLQRLNEGSVSVGFRAGRHRPAGTRPRRARRVDAAAIAGHRGLRAGLDLHAHARPVQGPGCPGRQAHRGRVSRAAATTRSRSQLLAVYGVDADGAASADGTTLVSEGGMAVVDMLAPPDRRGHHHRGAAGARRAAAPGRQRCTWLRWTMWKGWRAAFRYFQPVTLKRGSVDPRRDLPPHDIDLLATTANLVVRDELHPALGLPAARSRAAGAQATQPDQPARRFPEPEGDRLPAVDRSRALLQERPPVPAELPAVLGGELCAAAAVAARSRWPRSWSRWPGCCRRWSRGGARAACTAAMAS